LGGVKTTRSGDLDSDEGKLTAEIIKDAGKIEGVEAETCDSSEAASIKRETSLCARKQRWG